ncbi:MAG: hypothetical protein JRC77_00985 [Deltaproteobacteria bacterium]|nr:hypothetical protein [Deltaproteobacteria bacterium]
MRLNRAHLFVLTLGLLTVCLSQEADAKRYYVRQVASEVSLISEVFESAKIDDRVMVEGRVVNIQGRRIFELEDSSGKIFVVIESSYIREHGQPVLNERIRVEGRYGHKIRDASKVGIRVHDLMRNVDKPESETASAVESEVKEIPFPTTGQAPADGMMLEATLTDDTRGLLRNARRRVLSARDEVKAANMEYGKALGREESDEEVMAAIVDRQNTASTELTSALEAIPGVVETARKAGVSEESLTLYQEMVYGQH